MTKPYRNTKKTWKIVDSEGKVIEYFRVKCAADQMFQYYQKIHFDTELRIEKT